MTKVIVVTRADQRRLHTFKLIDKCVAVVHDTDGEARLRAAGVTCEVVVSNTSTLVEKRNWILKNLVEPGEWFIGLDDNIRHFTMVKAPWRENVQNNTTYGKPPAGHKNWRKVYNEMVTPSAWLMEMQANIYLAEKEGAPLVGVATMENPFFRERHYSRVRFVKSKAFAMQNVVDLHWKYEMCHDSYLSALAIARYGRVLVDSFMHYKCKMYEEGGLGTRAERDGKGLLTQMVKICEEFPGLVAHGKGKNTALRFIKVTQASVEKWRNERKTV